MRSLNTAEDLMVLLLLIVFSGPLLAIKLRSHLGMLRACVWKEL